MECAHLETLTWLSQADLNELVKRSSKTKNVLKCKGEALVSSLDSYRVGLLVCRRKVLARASSRAREVSLLAPRRLWPLSSGRCRIFQM